MRSSEYPLRYSSTPSGTPVTLQVLQYPFRYYYLVVFAAYVVEEHPLAFPHSFSGWMRRHW